MTSSGSCEFYPLVLERETLAFGPKTLELIDRIESFSKSLASSARMPRFTMKARLLVEVCKGNARLADLASRKDCSAESRRYRSTLIDEDSAGFAAEMPQGCFHPD